MCFKVSLSLESKYKSPYDESISVRLETLRKILIDGPKVFDNSKTQRETRRGPALKTIGRFYRSNQNFNAIFLGRLLREKTLRPC